MILPSQAGCSTFGLSKTVPDRPRSRAGTVPLDAGEIQSFLDHENEIALQKVQGHCFHARLFALACNPLFSEFDAIEYQLLIA